MMLMKRLRINKNLKTWRNITLAFWILPLPKFLEISAPPPTANMVAIPNNIMVRGITTLTAANARSPTPCPTKIPSMTVYKDEINMAKAEGIA